jgi:hypothetical protein
MEFGINEAPRNKRKAVEKNTAVKLMEDAHVDLLEAIACHERIDQDEMVVVRRMIGPQRVDHWMRKRRKETVTINNQQGYLVDCYL